MFSLLKDKRTKGRYTLRTTESMTRPLDLVHINTTGTYSASLRESQYVLILVGSALRLQRPYGTYKRGAFTIVAYVKRFVEDMSVPAGFRAVNGLRARTACS